MTNTITRKTIILTVALMAISSIAFATAPVVSNVVTNQQVDKTGAVIVVTPELLDLGNVPSVFPAEGEFTITNSGDVDLVIGTVRASCSCTATAPDSRNVPPGESTNVKVKLSTANRVGKQTHTVYIESNASNQSPVRVQVTAFVQSSSLSQDVTTEKTNFLMPSINPGSLAFDDLNADEVRTKQLEIAAAEPDGIKLLDIISQPAWVKVTSRSEGEGMQRHILLQVTPITNKINKYASGTIMIRTNYPMNPNVQIPISASLLQTVLVTPDMMPTALDSSANFYFGVIEKGSIAERTVTLKSSASKAFVVESVDNPLPYLKVSISVKNRGLVNYVKASVLKTATIGNIKGNITIHTTDPNQKKIVLSVFGIVK